MLRPWPPVFHLVLAAVAAAGLSGAAGAADEESAPGRKADEKEAARKADLEEVRVELKRSADFLAKQQDFRFHAQLGWDVLQANGQMLEFGGERSAHVRRPDRLRVDSVARTGGQRTLIFDGSSIAIDLPDAAAYVSVAKPGTIDEALDYLVDDLGIPAPLADFLYSDFYAGIADRIDSGFIVAEERLADLDTVHVAFRASGVDAQLWIEDGERPLPVRIVISHPGAEGSPQFWANLHGWDLAPEAEEGAFTFVPSEGAELIPVSVAVRDAREAREEEEAK